VSTIRLRNPKNKQRCDTALNRSLASKPPVSSDEKTECSPIFWGFMYLCGYHPVGRASCLAFVGLRFRSKGFLAVPEAKQPRLAPLGYSPSVSLPALAEDLFFKLTNSLIMKTGTTKPPLHLHRNLLAALAARGIRQRVTTQPQQNPIKNVIRSPE